MTLVSWVSRQNGQNMFYTIDAQWYGESSNTTPIS